MKFTDQERQEAITELKARIQPGDTLYSILSHVSSSGMLRVISTIAIKDNRPITLDWYIERILDLKRDKNKSGVRIGGCGMDMGFEIVYSLSRALYKDDFICLGTGCPSNDHVNGSRDYTPHKHSDGGYALKHEWI